MVAEEAAGPVAIVAAPAMRARPITGGRKSAPKVESRRRDTQFGAGGKTTGACVSECVCLEVDGGN